MGGERSLATWSLICLAVGFQYLGPTNLSEESKCNNALVAGYQGRIGPVSVPLGELAVDSNARDQGLGLRLRKLG
jgi:hypothetical protein